jgi:hypothetical protein
MRALGASASSSSGTLEGDDPSVYPRSFGFPGIRVEGLTSMAERLGAGRYAAHHTNAKIANVAMRLTGSQDRVTRMGSLLAVTPITAVAPGWVARASGTTEAASALVRGR